jgi:hypothetical protein
MDHGFDEFMRLNTVKIDTDKIQNLGSSYDILALSIVHDMPFKIQDFRLQIYDTDFKNLDLPISGPELEISYSTLNSWDGIEKLGVRLLTFNSSDLPESGWKKILKFKGQISLGSQSHTHRTDYMKMLDIADQIRGTGGNELLKFQSGLIDANLEKYF